MGSGGGGGGGSPTGRRRKSGGGGGFDASACAMSFETDLSSIDSDVAEAITIDDVLVVGIDQRGEFEAVVCRTNDGRYVGTVSHIENLAQLLACIRAGVGYQAHVRAVQATYCTVLIVSE